MLILSIYPLCCISFLVEKDPSFTLFTRYNTHCLGFVGVGRTVWYGPYRIYVRVEGGRDEQVYGSPNEIISVAHLSSDFRFLVFIAGYEWRWVNIDGAMGGVLNGISSFCFSVPLFGHSSVILGREKRTKRGCVVNLHPDVRVHIFGDRDRARWSS